MVDRDALVEATMTSKSIGDGGLCNATCTGVKTRPAKSQSNKQQIVLTSVERGKQVNRQLLIWVEVEMKSETRIKPPGEVVSPEGLLGESGLNQRDPLGELSHHGEELVVKGACNCCWASSQVM
jgi:hypothetical protein